MTTKVELAVYDLSQGMASQMSLPLIGTHVEGIWHTGVVIFGYEYFFGGGIQKMRNGVFARSHGMAPRQMLHMGDTDKTEAEVDAFVNSIRCRFTQQTYDLLRHNCNNFSNELTQFLLQKEIPHHILHLANNVFSTPGGAMLRPMIEGMMGRVNGGGGSGGNPFGGGGGGGFIGGSPAPSAPVPVLAPGAPAPIAIAYQEVAFRHTLHSKGGDCKLLDKLVSRITAAGEDEVGLSEERVEVVRAVGRHIQEWEGRPVGAGTGTGAGASAGAKVDAGGPCLGEIFAVLGDVLRARSDLQVPCLFVLRLAVLHISPSDGACRTLLADLVNRLRAFDLVGAGTPSVDTFSSVPAYVLALTVLANALSAGGAEAPALLGAGGFESQALLCDALLECCFRSLHAGADIAAGGRAAELQLAATALLFNLTAVATEFGKREHHWRLTGPGEDIGAGAEEAHPAVVQILCCLLEDETVTGDGESLGTAGAGGAPSTVVRMRKLSVLLMLARACSGSAMLLQVKHLLLDLGYLEALQRREATLATRHQAQATKAASDELSMVHELCTVWG